MIVRRDERMAVRGHPTPHEMAALLAVLALEDDREHPTSVLPHRAGRVPLHPGRWQASGDHRTRYRERRRAVFSRTATPEAASDRRIVAEIDGHRVVVLIPKESPT